MNVITGTLPPGARSLPAELMIPRQYRRVDWPAQRLLAGGPSRMQSYGGVRGISGIGDCTDPDPQTGQCPDGSMFTGGMSTTPVDTGLNTLPLSLPPVIIPTGTVSSSDPNYAAIASAISVGSTALAKVLAASNPGTYYKDPQGNVIYSQPTGNVQNLPGIYGNVGGGAVGTFTSPIGSGSFGGVSSGTLMMGAVLLFAFMMMGRR